MRACVFHGPGDVRVEDRPDPAAGPGELVLRPAATGICHSDIRVYQGQKHARPGVIPGHEVAGVVVEAGPGVEGYRPGDAVVVCPIVACGACFYCVTGRRNRCLQRVTLGYEEDGGLAEYLRLPASVVGAGQALPVPDGMSLELASLTEPAACVLNSLEACRVGAGSTLCLLGAGPMGLLHVVLARRLGAAAVIVSEPVEERRAYARRLGATHVVDPSAQDPLAAVRDATGGLGADAVVLTIGRPEAVPEALRLVRRQGVVNLFAGFPPGAVSQLDPNAVHYTEAVLTGTQNATVDQYRRALALLAGAPEALDVVTHRYGIEDAPQAYAARLGMEGLKSAVVFPPR